MRNRRCEGLTHSHNTTLKNHKEQQDAKTNLRVVFNNAKQPRCHAADHHEYQSMYPSEHEHCLQVDPETLGRDYSTLEKCSPQHSRCVKRLTVDDVHT